MKLERKERGEEERFREERKERKGEREGELHLQLLSCK
jgi:hypothetical protein